MKYCFGEKLRSVRERRSLTLREVAERAGVSESLVSQIERNLVNPAIDTLLSLADALNLDFEYLFADYRQKRPVIITRRTERHSFTRPGVLYERLARSPDVSGASAATGGIEAYRITIEPGAKTGNTEYGHPGWELGIVETGSAELRIGQEVHLLEPGDSVSFRSDAPHVLSNSGADPLELFWIITPPRGDMGKC
jgi:transcriptional regulator with XRE-family HTH domain/quercetin dioxygenase-like cupin family protein